MDPVLTLAFKEYSQGYSFLTLLEAKLKAIATGILLRYMSQYNTRILCDFDVLKALNTWAVYIGSPQPSDVPYLHLPLKSLFIMLPLKIA